MILQLFILAILLFIAFYTGRFLFWFLFLKDAPAYEEHEHQFLNFPEPE
jgi:hypothetical protein